MEKCPFCNPEELETEKLLIMASDTVFATFDKYPVSPGHTLLIPRRHVEDYFELKHIEKTHLWYMAEVVKQILDYVYKPDGYNIGINVLREAGQTVPHAHIHIIPRYEGDADNSRIGVLLK